LAIGDIVALDFMERVFAAKTPKAAKVSCLLSGTITILVGCVLAILGMMASIYYQGDTTVVHPFLHFIKDHLPTGIGMMVFMGLIGASISTSDGAIMATSTVVTKNIFQQNFPNLIPQDRLLLFSRLTTIPLTALAVVIAIIRPVPGDLLILAFDLVFAGCFVPLLFGIYWKKANSTAAFWAILIPSILRTVFYFFQETFIPEGYAGLDSLIPPMVSLILFVCLSLFTGNPSPKGTTLPQGAKAF